MTGRDEHPDTPPRDDERSDIEQAVDARKDVVERGEGGREPDSFTATGMPDGAGGTGGVTKNQEDAAQ